MYRADWYYQPTHLLEHTVGTGWRNTLGQCIRLRTCGENLSWVCTLPATKNPGSFHTSPVLCVLAEVITALHLYPYILIYVTVYIQSPLIRLTIRDNSWTRTSATWTAIAQNSSEYVFSGISVQMFPLKRRELVSLPTAGHWQTQ